MRATKLSTAILAAERAPVYADENIGRSVVELLRRRGFDLVTAREAGRLGVPDEQQLGYATSSGRVLLTHDRHDFRRLHLLWREAGRSHGGIVTVPQRGPAPRRGIRAALLLDWIATQEDRVSRFLVWGELQARLLAGLRLEGCTEREVRLALGFSDT